MLGYDAVVVLFGYYALGLLGFILFASAGAIVVATRGKDSSSKYKRCYHLYLGHIHIFI